MKRIFTFALALSGILIAKADDQVITLDLTKSTTPLTFDAENGAWTGTFDDDQSAINSQCFSFVHNSMGDYDTWWGFTASNSADNQYQSNTLKYQYSNMAKGGIVLNEDGTVKTDEFGAVVVNSAVPYIVAYYSPYMSRRPVDMTFTDGKAYEAVGVYVNLNSYTYYSLTDGALPARAFTNNDKLTLTIHGVAPDESEKTVDVVLGSYINGDLTATRGWKYVDLSPLGTVNELYFTMSSTDAGSFGDNTPEYFCLDKLMVKESDNSGVQSVKADGAIINYDRASHTVNISGAEFAMICDVKGNMLMSGETNRFDLSQLPAGVYIVKAGNNSLKITK
ncbi:MAG: DUF4465 domain-containing protein [Muribaculum sp.]|nr:DUF4465 domain-containing protein [Muribaculum sp.]